MKTFVLFLSLLLVGVVLAVDSPASSPTQADLDKTVRELGDSQYLVRHAAFERLLAWAITDAGVLKRLPASDKDPEVNESLENLSRKVQEHVLEVRREFYRGELIRLAGEDAKLKTTLQNLLDRATEETVLAAKELVSLKGGKALVSALAGYLAECLLEHSDSAVCTRIMETLGKLGEKSVVPSLVKCLEEAPNMMDSAALALNELGDKSLTPRLLRLLENTNPGVRRGAALALGGLGDKSLAPQLVKLLEEDPDRGVRYGAAKALGDIGDKSIVPQLLKLLGYANPSVRGETAWTLGRLGDRSVVPQIAKLLEDPDQGVIDQAVTALGLLGDKSAVPQLVECLEDADTNVRSNAARALGQLGDRSVAPQLLKLLDDDDATLRWSVTGALGNLGEKSVAPRLAKLLEDADKLVREGAGEALRKLSGEKWSDYKLEESAKAWWTQHKDDPEFRPPAPAEKAPVAP